MHQMYVLIQNLAHEASSPCGRFSSGAYEEMGSKGWWGVGSAKSGGNNARSIGLKADCLGAAVHDGAWSMDGKSWRRGEGREPRRMSSTERERTEVNTNLY